MTALSVQQNNYVAFDSELPSVAAMAAAEVDDLLRHEGNDLAYLTKLSEIIGQIFEDTVAHDTVTFRLVDPVTIDVMSKSMTELRGTPLRSIEELTEAMHDLTIEIAKVKDRDDALLNSESFLTQLKQFCISLSRFALASRDNIETSITSSDYRR